MRFPTAILALAALVAVAFAPAGTGASPNIYTAYGHFTLGADAILGQPTAPDCSEAQKATTYACVAIPAAAVGEHFSVIFSSVADSGAGNQKVCFFDATGVVIGQCFEESSTDKVGSGFCPPYGYAPVVPAGATSMTFSSDFGVGETGVLYVFTC